MKCLLFALSLVSVCAFAADAPPPEAFRVLPPARTSGPVVTRYLEYQADMAWREDAQRQERWRAIRTEQDLMRLEQDLRERLLAMLGGLPAVRTPLNAHITGRIAMSGFHIEKLIFESLPGVYVTALVYVPEDVGKKHPAVLVPSGHSAKGKAYYQALCQRLVERGYLVICWDAIGQGERSQFWDRKNGKSRYNLICAEHAVLGNLAYLAGTNLARWEIWDGIRALDYLLTRADVDRERINITGTSGGGFQTAHIAALDARIKVAAPSCYITALPMRVYNRIFSDPDSDPEQDLAEMISSGIDHPGLLLMMYPRPVFVAAAVLDYFPIEGTHKTFREVADLYSRFGHSDRISMREGYHGHQYSPENQEAMIEFLDHFNGMPPRHDLPPVKELDDQTLQSTRTGQVMLDFENARSLMDVIRDYYLEHRSQPARTLKQLYYSGSYPGIDRWNFFEFDGAIPAPAEVRWQASGRSSWGQVDIDRYLLHHSRYLEMPLLWIHKNSRPAHKALLWLGENGKATKSDWQQITPYLESGFDIISIDPRGLGETRMPYKAISPDDPTLAKIDFDRAEGNPLSGALADYVYNSLLTGRPYFLQMMEDAEIAMRFAHRKFAVSDFAITGSGNAYLLASAVSETLPSVKLVIPPGVEIQNWSDLVEHEQELWPIQDLLPGGAYIH